MRPKLPAGGEPDALQDKAIPVKAIYFGQVVKWPQLAGAGSCLRVGRPENSLGQNIIYCDSIFEYRGSFCINAQFWVDKSCAYILCHEY